MSEYPAGLEAKLTPGGRIEKVGGNTWRLEISSGSGGEYRLAQLDDYQILKRRDFPWNAPLRLSLRARASASSLPGTWGFGLWNEPFGMGILSGTALHRLPVLPQAAWFFFASNQNYLSLRDDLPAWGEMAATFRSRQLSPIMTTLGIPLLTLLFLPPLARKLRGLARRFIYQDTKTIPGNVTEWHNYQIGWEKEELNLFVDGIAVLRTNVSPEGPLGLVIWIDNQFAALPPSGHVRFGTLSTEEPAWIEISDMTLKSDFTA